MSLSWRHRLIANVVLLFSLSISIILSLRGHKRPVCEPRYHIPIVHLSRTASFKMWVMVRAATQSMLCRMSSRLSCASQAKPAQTNNTVRWTLVGRTAEQILTTWLHTAWDVWELHMNSLDHSATYTYFLFNGKELSRNKRTDDRLIWISIVNETNLPPCRSLPNIGRLTGKRQ